MAIENSFGRLKGRWRSLQKRLDVDVEFACTVIAACVIFHNICELNHERYDEEWTENEPNNVNEDQTIGDELNELYVNELLCAKSMRDDLAVAMSSGNI